MKVFGITGTLGAGKGTVVTYLMGKGFSHFSARDFLFEEVDRRGLLRNRDSLNQVGEDLRATYGAGFVVESLYDKAESLGVNAIIESIRALGEVDALKEKGGFLIAIDADPKVRYERIQVRASETDTVTFEKFISDEERETSGNNPSRMNLRRCMERADFSVTNNGSIVELYRQLDTLLATVLKSS